VERTEDVEPALPQLGLMVIPCSTGRTSPGFVPFEGLPERLVDLPIQRQPRHADDSDRSSVGRVGPSKSAARIVPRP
jgi:hypothetical protein